MNGPYAFSWASVLSWRIKEFKAELNRMELCVFKEARHGARELNMRANILQKSRNKGQIFSLFLSLSLFAIERDIWICMRSKEAPVRSQTTMHYVSEKCSPKG